MAAWLRTSSVLNLAVVAAALGWNRWLCLNSGVGAPAITTASSKQNRDRQTHLHGVEFVCAMRDQSGTKRQREQKKGPLTCGGEGSRTLGLCRAKAALYH